VIRPLRIVVGPDLGRTVSRFPTIARRSRVRAASCLRQHTIEEARPEHLHGLDLVLQLRFLILLAHDQGRWAGGVMRTALSVVLTLWGHRGRMSGITSILRSCGSILMSTSSASGKHGHRRGRGCESSPGSRWPAPAGPGARQTHGGADRTLPHPGPRRWASLVPPSVPSLREMGSQDNR